MGAFGAGLTATLTDPTVRSAFGALIEAGEVSAKWFEGALEFVGGMAELGFPCMVSTLVEAPFDYLATSMRGMRGAMIDMYRRPQKLKAAMERLRMLQLPGAIAEAQSSGNPRVALLLFRGSDGFMSLEQFEEFYWPGAKELILALVEEGLTPCAWFEGVWDQRLDYLAQLPAGKILGFFERTNLTMAKEKLGDVLCIAGGMPITLLQAGSPDAFRQKTKENIRTLGAGGGYIMACSTAMSSVPEENLQAWVDATREFGAY